MRRWFVRLSAHKRNDVNGSVNMATGIPGIDGPFEVKVDLPDKLSDLIDLAVSDYKALDQSRYYPDSERWHVPYYVDNRACAVCLSGAVIANTFRGAIEFKYSPKDFEGSEDKLHALDRVRAGGIWSALDLLGVYAVDMTPVQVDVVADMRTEFDSGAWSGLCVWEGWEDLEDSLSNLTRVAAKLRSVGL